MDNRVNLWPANKFTCETACASSNFTKTLNNLSTTLFINTNR